MVLYERNGEDIDRGLVGYWKLDDLKRIPSDGIIAHYKMNDNAANTDVIDSKGGNTGTSSANTSGLTAAGKINEAFLFDGATTFVNIPHNANQLFRGSFAFAAWVKPATIGENEAGNMIDKADGTFGENGFVWLMVNAATPQMNFILNDGSQITSAASSITLGAWNHIVVSVSSDGTVTHYINGAVSGTPGVSGALSGITTTTDLRIGNRSGGTDRTIDGEIDDVRIYDRELSLAEVQTIYNSGSGTETTELFRQTIVAIDRANFNDGVITGSTNTEGINGLNADAMFFDGIDDNVIVPHNIILSPNFFSLSCIFKSEDLTSERVILDKRDFPNNGGYVIILETNGTVKFSLYDGTFADLVSIGTFDDGKFHTVTATYDEVTMKLYIDGVLNNTKSSTKDVTNSTVDLGIGSNPVGVTNYDGTLQNARIYNRILTAGEASKIARLKL